MGQILQLGDVQIDQDKLADLCRHYGVRELSLFGSAVRGEMRPGSDMDVMVEFDPSVRVGLLKFESLNSEHPPYSPKNTRSSSRVTDSGMGASVPTV